MMDKIENLTTLISHRICGVFCIGLMPAAVIISISEKIKIEQIQFVLIGSALLWIIYVNMWSKKAAILYQAEVITQKEAWSKSRVFLNTELITKLAFIPGVGIIFDNWINRNNQSNSGDREIKTTQTTEAKK